MARRCFQEKLVQAWVDPQARALEQAGDRVGSQN